MKKESKQIKDNVSWIEVFPVKIIFLKDSFIILTLLPFTNEIREAVKNYLTENHFAKKPLAERGGTTPPRPPPNRKSDKLFREIFS